MRIAVDAMGGDHAPAAIVEGAIRASARPGMEILLVGRRSALEPLLPRSGQAKPLRIVDAEETIEMGESPVQAVRKKRNASLVVCGDLVKNGEADAFVSAGNTGAGMVVAKQKLKAIPGIDRPGIATILPSLGGKVVLMDAGANVDCSPLNLQQFAIMGSIYAEQVLGVPTPRVGLLNIGEEESKGNELARESFPLLQQAPVRFIGNVEGRDIFNGSVDVVVCDGFVGNVVIKVGEGAASLLYQLIRSELKRSLRTKLGALLMKPALEHIARRTNYEEVGGAQLLGVNGVCIISHGSSRDHAIANAIGFAEEAVRHGVVDKIGCQVGDRARRDAALV